MKRSLFLLSFAFALQAQAQLISNPGFEDWDEVEDVNLQAYESSNLEATAIGAVRNAVPDSDAVSGNFALHLSTHIAGGDTAFGYIIDGDFDNQTGGFAINQRPDSIAGYFKCDVMPGDTAFVILFFRNAGVPIGAAEVYFTGTQTSFARFVQEIDWFVPSISPDSAFFAAASSNAINEIGIQDGSSLTIDDIQLIGTGITANIQNPSFENWDTSFYYRPHVWESFAGDPFGLRYGLVERISDPSEVYAGDYSIKVNSLLDDGDSLFGLVSTEDIFNNERGGFPFDRNQDTLTFYYRYAPSGSDTAAVAIWIRHNGIWESNYTTLGAAVNWTYVEIPFAASGGGTVDSLSLSFSSSTAGGFASGSSLWLDELDFKICDLPGDPGAIRGVVETCEGASGLVFEIDPISDASGYQWTVPTGLVITAGQDSTAIVVDVSNGASSGGVHVAGTVYCGVGRDTSLQLTVNAIPAKPSISQNSSNDSLISSETGTSYIWFHNGIQLAAQSQMILASRTGEYTLVVLNGDCVSDTSDAYTFTVPNVEEPGSAQFGIYPNPTSSLVQLEGASEIREVQVFSMDGRIIKHFLGDHRRLDIRDLKSGLYHLVIQGTEGEKVLKLAIE